MADASARYTKGRCNRRYKDWLFEVRDNVVVYMTAFASVRNVPTPGPDEFLVYEECEMCEGKGCRVCEGTGQVAFIRRERPRTPWR